MEKTLYNLLFLLLPVSGLMAQMPENRQQWQEQALTWTDFSGAPDLLNDFDANTNSGLSYSWSLRTSEAGVEFLYRVEVFFNPDLSWVKPESRTVSLLAHEQLHFDITELHGRKLRKVMSDFVPDLNSDIKKNMERVYQSSERSRRQMQEKYDRETNHGQNEGAQRKWEGYIIAEMAQLEEFSS